MDRQVIGVCFSRMLSKGSRFTWGLQVGDVFARRYVYVRNRSERFATVWPW